jgi:biopolymer transport protein ExbD
MVPVASMGDIAFLLIIFFLVVSEFAKDVPVEQPESEDIARLEETPPVSVVIDNEKRFYLDGEEIEEANLESTLISTVNAIANVEARSVVFKADKTLTYSDIEPVLEILAKAGVPVALGGTETENKDSPNE